MTPKEFAARIAFLGYETIGDGIIKINDETRLWMDEESITVYNIKSTLNNRKYYECKTPEECLSGKPPVSRV